MNFLRRFRLQKRTKLPGKNVRAAFYDDKNNTLTVWSKSRGKKLYPDASKETYTNLTLTNDPDWYYSFFIEDDVKKRSDVIKWLVVLAVIILIAAVIFFENR